MLRLSILITFLATLFACYSAGLGAQSAAGEGIRALEFAETDEEAYGILYELVSTRVEANRDPGTTLNLAKKLVIRAGRLNDPTLSAPAYYQLALAQVQAGDQANAERSFDAAATQAMVAGDTDMIIVATDRATRLKTESGRYREASSSSQRTLDYFVRQGDDNSISRMQADLESAKALLNVQQREIEAAREELNRELATLTAERNRLAATNAQHAADIDRHVRELSKTQEQKAVVEQRVAAARTALGDLSREALEQRTIATAAREDLAREQLDRQSAQMHAQEQSFRLYLTLAAAFVLALMVLGIYLRFRSKTKTAARLAAANEEIKVARQESDDLLANILPADIARELKATGTARARQFPAATVLFCDFVNFTSIAEQLGAEALVMELDKCFRGFDRIMGAHAGIEKIKTIGDAYMAASGLKAEPEPPVNLVRAALEMQAFLQLEITARRAAGLPYFEGRIGLHTGAVVAGVVGEKKFAYDIWGDTVNLASRMESECAPGRVNVSAATHALVHSCFATTRRGEIAAKNMGKVEMYYVDGELEKSSGPATKAGLQPRPENAPSPTT